MKKQILLKQCCLICIISLIVGCTEKKLISIDNENFDVIGSNDNLNIAADELVTVGKEKTNLLKKGNLVLDHPIIDETNSVAINDGYKDSHPAKMIIYDVFVSEYLGQYRIPSLVETNNGVLIAICEKRDAQGDKNGNDIVMRRSLNGGISWQNEVLIDEAGDNSLNDPTMVVSNGNIIILMYEEINKSTKEFVNYFVRYSDNDGATWTEATNIKDMIYNPTLFPYVPSGETPFILPTSSDNPIWAAFGPGNGISIRNGDYTGRIVMPLRATFSADTESNGRIINLFNDAINGITNLNSSNISTINNGWIRSYSHPFSRGGEVQMVEIAGAGRIYYLARNSSNGGLVNYDTSPNSGVTWDGRNKSISKFPFRTQSGLLRIDKTINGSSGPHIYHSTPMGEWQYSKGRTDGYLFAATHQIGSLTWKSVKSILITRGFFSNSSLAEVSSKYGETGRIGVLYEFHTDIRENKVKQIRYMSLDLSWVNSGSVHQF